MNKKVSILGGGIIGVLIAFLLDSLYNDLEIHLFTYSDSKNKQSVLTLGDEFYNIDGFPYLSTSSPLLKEVFKVCNQESKLLARQSLTSKFRKVIYDKKNNLFSKIPSSPHASLLFNNVLFFGDRFRSQKALGRPFFVREEMSIYDLFYEMCGKTFAESFGASLSRYHFSTDPSKIQFASAYPEIYLLLKEGFSLRDALLHKQKSRKSLYQDYFSDANDEKFYYSFLTTELDVVNTLLARLQVSPSNNTFHLHKEKVTRVSYKKNMYTLRVSSEEDIENIDSLIITEYSTNILKVLKDTEHKLYKAFKNLQFSTKIYLYSLYPNNYYLDAFYHTFSFRDKHSFYGLTNLSLLDGFNSKKSTLLMSSLADNRSLFSVDELADMVHKNQQRLWNNKLSPLEYQILEKENDFSYGLGTKIYLDTLNNLLDTSYPSLFVLGSPYGMSSFQKITDKMLELLLYLDKKLDFKRTSKAC